YILFRSKHPSLIALLRSTPFTLAPILFLFLFFLILRRPPISTLFPYTTLFRSNHFYHSGLQGKYHLSLPFHLPSLQSSHHHKVSMPLFHRDSEYLNHAE